jgi:dTDP-4-amino-4,6-dideoxygalactose transaminase
MRPKADIGDLALFGGTPMFARPKSIGSLAKPDYDRFLNYSRISVDAHQYTNNGPVNRLLEDRLASFHDTERCVTFSSAFFGLSLAMRCLALPGRAEAIMPSLTYRRMAEIAVLAGLVPRFCEVNPVTLAQDAMVTAECINVDTALIIGVHPTVNCCDASGLESLSAEANVPLLFDSVESTYETYGGRKVGSFGAAEGFSMHASKLINGFEGGYITTNDHELADRLTYMRGFGFVEADRVVEFGFNAKLNELHAAMAMASLDDLESLVERNRERYELYRSALRALGGISVREFDESEQCSFKNVLAELDERWPVSRQATIDVLHAEGALARPYYSPALHTKPTGFEKRFGPLPITEELAERFILLPCGDQMSADDVASVVSALAVISESGEELTNRLASMGGEARKSV